MDSYAVFLRGINVGGITVKMAALREALAWPAPAGGTLESPFNRLSARPRYKAAITIRNLPTMIKVRDAAACCRQAGRAGAGLPVDPKALSALPPRPC